MPVCCGVRGLYVGVVKKAKVGTYCKRRRREGWGSGAASFRLTAMEAEESRLMRVAGHTTGVRSWLCRVGEEGRDEEEEGGSLCLLVACYLLLCVCLESRGSREEGERRFLILLAKPLKSTHNLPRTHYTLHHSVSSHACCWIGWCWPRIRRPVVGIVQFSASLFLPTTTAATTRRLQIRHPSLWPQG